MLQSSVNQESAKQEARAALKRGRGKGERQRKREEAKGRVRDRDRQVASKCERDREQRVLYGCLGLMQLQQRLN